MQLERDAQGGPVLLGHGRAAAVCLGRLGGKAVAVKVRCHCVARVAVAFQGCRAWLPPVDARALSAAPAEPQARLPTACMRLL